MTNRDMPDLCDYLDAICLYARVVGRDGAHIDDLVQEYFVRALSQPKIWRETRNARACLLSILHNAHVDGRRHAATASPPGQVRPPLLRELVRALQMLPEPRRQIVLLTALEGMSYQEVADLLDVPVGTVMSRLSRARNSLRESTDEMDSMIGPDEASGPAGGRSRELSARADAVVAK